MNKKIFNLRLFRYFRRLIYGKNPGNLSPTEKRKVAVETNLRWEDDGGPVVEIPHTNEPGTGDNSSQAEVK